MATRTLFRRLFHVNRGIQVQRCALARSLGAASSSLNQYNYTGLITPSPNYSHIRGFCSKAGEGMIINIQNEADFEKSVLKNSLPVVVDFHATWCGPCRLLGPRLESLIGAKKGQVILARVDVDENEELAMKYLISSVPTVLGLKNGEVKDKFIGLQDDEIIETFLDRLIG